MSFKKGFLKNVVTLGGYNYSSQLINFVGTIILSRLLLPEEYGYIALITTFTGFITIFSDAGLSYGIIRSDLKFLYEQSVNQLAWIVGILLFIIMCMLAYPIALFYGELKLVFPTLVMSLSFISRSITIVPKAILTKQLDFKFLGKIRLIEAVSILLLTIVLAWLKLSYWSLVLPSVIVSFLLYFPYKKQAVFKNGSFRKKYIIVAFKKSRSLLGNISTFNLVNYWARNADNLLVGKVYGSASLGIYNRAYRFLTMTLELITSLFGTVLYPSLVELKSKKGDVLGEYYGVLGMISILNFPIALILIVFPTELVKILWGENWLTVSPFLPYFGLLILTQTLISTTGNMFMLLNKEKIFMKIGIASSILMVSSIVIGSLFSVLNVARFYCVGYINTIIPIVLYFGFYKSFNANISKLFKFWLPKLLAVDLVLFALWLEFKYLVFIGLASFFVHLLANQKKEIKKLIYILQKRLKDNNNKQ